MFEYGAIGSLVLIIAGLIAWIFSLRRKLRQIRASLKELLQENESQHSNLQASSGDIYFKIDKDFNIVFINDSGAAVLGYAAAELVGRPAFGSLFEDRESGREALNAAFVKICKHQSTFNTQAVLVRRDGQKQLMLCRLRPILNEILECEGVSFLCKDISEARIWQDNLSQFQEKDIFTNILNETAILNRFEHDFRLAKRYNRKISCVVVDLRDIYAFISKGIDFETADKMLKVVSEVCVANLPKGANIGRVEKTKIYMELNGIGREEARAAAFKILDDAVAAIKTLRVDEYNARMIVITYTNRRNVNDTCDAMRSRMRRHINTALKHREYGVVSSDDRGNILERQ